MTPADKPAFADAWTAAMELFERKPSPGAIELAFSLLVDYPLETVTDALRDHLRDGTDGRFPPKPADIVRNISLRAAQEALEAWKSVLAHLNPYVSPVFASQRTAGAVTAIGGWRAMCEMTCDQMERVKPRFVEAWLAGSRPSGSILKGLVETHNEKHRVARNTDLMTHFPHQSVWIADRLEECHAIEQEH